MPKIREIVLVPHTHHDIGYTNTPQACLLAHERAIYDVLDLCEADMESISPEAFCWTMEISRPVLQFLRHAPSKDVDRLRALVAMKRVSVTGGYLHMTQLIGHEEYVRFFLPVREIRDDYGLPVSVVQHADVNGLSWGVVPLMRQAGLDCLVMGLNPDHGLPPAEQPSAFYWQGQDGSSVLVWLSSHYGHCDDWGITSGRVDSAITPIKALIERVEARSDYPFDFIMLHAAQDNMWPNRQAAEAALGWNRRGLEPPMCVATIDTVMERAREQASKTSLPVLRGEWADWWAHGHGSSAYEVAVARQAQSDLRSAHTIQALARFAAQDRELEIPDANVPVIAWYRRPSGQVAHRDTTAAADRVYDDLLLFEEHTWGSFDSVTRPFELFAQAHWNEKARFAYGAAGEARALSREAAELLLVSLPRGDAPALAVINTLSVPRDDIAVVGTVAGDVAVPVHNVPPLGVTVLPWDGPEPSTQPPTTPLGAATSQSSFENNYYLIEIDRDTASISRWLEKSSGREWVDRNAMAGIGAVIYEQTDPADAHPAVRLDRRHFSPANPGPDFIRTVAAGTGAVYARRSAAGITVSMEAEAPYLPSIRTSVTLYDSLSYIDLRVSLDKRENYGMEGVYVAFPFALENPTFIIESANCVFEACNEQLLGSCRDWYSVQHAVGIREGREAGGAGVLWASKQAPLVQIGEIRTGRWDPLYVPTKGHLYAWLMNNLYFTNFKAAQGGRMNFDFRLGTRRSSLAQADVRAWGEAFAFPPVALIGNIVPGEYRWLDVEPRNVQVQVVEARPDGEIMIRLKETSGIDTRDTLSWSGEARLQLFSTDILETQKGSPLPRQANSFHFHLTPHQLATLRAKLEW